MKLIDFALIFCLILKFQSISANCNLNCTNGYVNYKGVCEECGKSSYIPNIRIVGGTKTKAYSWPADVYLRISISGDFNVSNTIIKNYNRTTICGGTLINRYTVLTAAHCLYINFKYLIGNSFKQVTIKNLIRSNFKLPIQVEVYLGATDVSFIRAGKSPTSPTVKFIAQSYKMHQNYDSSTYINDIALISLPKAVTYNQYIQFACLPDSQYGVLYPPLDNTVYAVGRGHLNEASSSNQDVSSNVKLTNYDTSYCSHLQDPTTQLCAGDLSGNRDTCYGDSGGGLYTFDDNRNKYIVAGITSYSIGCARVNLPAVYTRISYYYDWIITNWKINDSINNQPCTTTGLKNSSTKFNFSSILLFSLITYILISNF